MNTHAVQISPEHTRRTDITELTRRTDITEHTRRTYITELTSVRRVCSGDICTACVFIDILYGV